MFHAINKPKCPTFKYESIISRYKYRLSMKKCKELNQVSSYDPIIQSVFMVRSSSLTIKYSVNNNKTAKQRKWETKVQEFISYKLANNYILCIIKKQNKFKSIKCNLQIIHKLESKCQRNISRTLMHHLKELLAPHPYDDSDDDSISSSSTIFSPLISTVRMLPHLLFLLSCEFLFLHIFFSLD